MLKENFKEFKVGSHLRVHDLEDLMMFIIRFFNWNNSMYRVEYNEPFDYYDLYWKMTQRQYNTLCEERRKSL